MTLGAAKVLRWPPRWRWPAFLVPVGLQARIALLVSSGILVLMTLFVVLGLSALQASSERDFEGRAALARIAAEHVDFLLSQAISRTGWAAVEIAPALAEGDAAAASDSLVRAAQRLSPLANGLILFDPSGVVVDRALSYTQGFDQLGAATLDSLDRGKQWEIEWIWTKNGALAAVAVPITYAEAPPLGTLVAVVDLSASALGNWFHGVTLGKTGRIDVMDGRGLVLTSAEEVSSLESGSHTAYFSGLLAGRQPVVTTCFDCHATKDGLERRRDLMAFAPLSVTSGAVVLRQSEQEVLEPTQWLERQVLALGIVSLLVALGIAWITTRGIILPVRTLTFSARRIAEGKIEEPVRVTGAEEIAELGRTLEYMRGRLQESLESVRAYNEDLNRRVLERTAELEASRAELQQKERIRRELLEKAIVAQEEERKRIARELHDQTSQALAALAVAVETTATEASEGRDVRASLARMKSLALSTLEEVHHLVFDLRPTLLDDLGLIAALRWYGESRLGSQGVAVRLETAGRERRLPPQVETALYRVVQEAVNNVAKHSGAQNCTIYLESRPRCLSLTVEDDGSGFDMAELARSRDGKRGLGLMGMKERVELLGGSLSVRSEPGGGTRLDLQVPLEEDGCA